MNQEKLGLRPEGSALMWTYVIYGTAIVISFAIGYPFFGFPGALLVLGTLFLLNFMLTAWTNSPTQYSVIERLGNFYKIVGPGLRWRIFLVDKIVEDPFKRLGKNQTVTVQRRKIILYTKKYDQDEQWKHSITEHINFETHEVDYADVAGVDIFLSFFGGIGKENSRDTEEIYQDIYKFVYVYSDVAARLLSLAEGFVRSTLQKLKLEEANVVELDLYNMEFENEKQQKEFERSKKELKEGCEEVGWELEKSPFILQDNGVPEAAIKATHEAFTEKKKGEGAKDRFETGTFGPIADLMKPKTKGGLGLKKEEAVQLFLADKSMNTLPQVPNPTLIVGEGGLPKVLDVSGMNQSSKTTKNSN